MGGAKGGECYISKPRWSSGKIFDPGGPSSGLKEALFLEIVYLYFWPMNMKQRSCVGRGARSAPLGVAMRPKRQVRAAHGRARAAKTH